MNPAAFDAERDEAMAAYDQLVGLDLSEVAPERVDAIPKVNLLRAGLSQVAGRG